ncbi:2,3-diketo-5-methylthio-1-phosphopentane phosphatase [Rhizoctonia solani]|uniref:2,3-diketo-5-methylthio-1-phosphopentane phosphatase n=1 Tax=Rhizoctonia solani TaxID=456999 RepID=A0A8H8SWW2_9AGAM|nr:2,3-diketo-5-methylthio-1-phosphopentane phosphatase [Rhizoctonia solani]QRW21446.1 2,3-diketo-5-methylthio-1-phosphopentane phosphatase [Rhizoctonia solani]
MPEVKSQLVVYDFDWSMVDQDTDRYVLEVLSPKLRRKLEDDHGKTEWTDLLAGVMHDLHDEGATREQIEHALITLPYHPAMIRGVKALKAANSPKTTFLYIVTNKAEWHGDRLDIRRHIGPDDPPHGCTVGCSPNLCKGSELTSFLARCGETYDRIMYVGDGSNDFCPSVRLSENDVVLCRRDRALERRIKGAPEGQLKATVKYWEGAWEIEEYFNSLIKS